MFKRIIAKMSKKINRKGYTMAEMMVVIGIIAVLCAIAIPSIIAISRSLAFKEANDYAESIFMAVQDNLTEMRSEGRLIELRDCWEKKIADLDDNKGFPLDEDALNKDQYMYCTSQDTAVYDVILPATAIDSTVRDGNILIEYNPYTGNVYSVFYCKRGNPLSYDGNNGTTAVTRDEEARKELKLGYYCGSTLSGIPITEDETKATISYDNGEEGIVRVSVPVPKSYKTNPNAFLTGLKVDLKITAETLKIKDESGKVIERSITIPVKAEGGTDDNCKITVNDEGKQSVVVEYRLDSLYEKASFASLGYCNGTTEQGSVDLLEAEFAKVESANGVNSTGGSSYISLENTAITDIKQEGKFNIYPGENVKIEADITYKTTGSKPAVAIEAGAISGVNPMFDALVPSPTDKTKYVITVANGRQLQNLNAIASRVVNEVGITSVIFTDDVDWNDTVKYYNVEYGNGKTYTSFSEAPARALPYFVPINNEDLFGTAKFIFYDDNSETWLKVTNRIKELLNRLGTDITLDETNNTPTLTDELDTAAHASIMGNGHKIVNIKIDSTKYALGKNYYAGTADANIDKFTGVFGYINTTIDGLHIVNPVIKGGYFNHNALTKTTSPNNPAVGALVGACGYNTLITNCSTYIDTADENYNPTMLMTGSEKQKAYLADYLGSNTKEYYGVVGNGAVGGLVGYAKSHRTVSGELDGNTVHLAFSDCFAAVPVTGNMRGTEAEWPFLTITAVVKNMDKIQYGYTNGVGGLIGNAEISNFYNCYASGMVYAEGIIVQKISDSITGAVTAVSDLMAKYMETSVIVNLFYNGRSSMGAGAFVGSSHGVRYTNCFAAGDIFGVSAAKTQYGLGSFAGVMSYEETLAYGNDNDKKTEISQQTVFQSCYSAGLAQIKYNDGSSDQTKTVENFSGANARIKFDSFSGTASKYWAGSYYHVYAPWWYEAGSAKSGTGTHIGYDLSGKEWTIEELPYESFIYKDSYNLSYYANDETTGVAGDATEKLSAPLTYEDMTDITGLHNDSVWIKGQIKSIKATSTSELVQTFENIAVKATETVLGAATADKVKNEIDSTKAAASTYGGIYFGDWVNKDLKDFTYLFKDYSGLKRYEAPDYAAQGGLLSRFLMDHGALVENDTLQSTLASITGDDFAYFQSVRIAGGNYALRPTSWEYITDVSSWTKYFTAHYANSLSTLNNVYEALYRDGFPDSEWEKGSSGAATHSYDVVANADSKYPFTKLEGVEYYGSWTEKPSACGLAYFEEYSDGTYGYYYNRDASSTLRDDLEVVSDGYAILAADTDAKSVRINDSSTITVYYSNDTFSTTVSAYKVFRLPASVLNSYAADDFYTKLEVLNVPIEVKVGSSTQQRSQIYTMYFNPNAALTQVNPVDDGTDNGSKYTAKKPGTPSIIYIRTARQLAALNDGLSAFAANSGITFQQLRNIDAATYDTSIFNPASFDGVSSFGATYTGTAAKATIEGFNSPIFNTNNGKVENLAVLMGNDVYGGSTSESSGLVVRVNNGTVSNVDLTVSAERVIINASKNAGLLVGLNTGTVTDCTATAKTVNFPVINAGGLVGCSNKGTVANCTVTVSGDITANGTLGGFIGSAVNSVLTDDTANVGGTMSAGTVGGFAGSAEKSTIKNPVVSVGGDITASAVAGGFAGNLLSGGVNNAAVTVAAGQKISAPTAGGFTGTFGGTSLVNDSVTINGTVNGTSYAGGFAGTASGGILSGYVYLNGTVTSTGMTAGFVAKSDAKISDAWVCMADTNAKTTTVMPQTPAAAKIIGSTEAAGLVCESNGDVINSYVCGKGEITAAGGDAAGLAIKVNGGVSGCTVTPVRHDLYGYDVDILKAAYIKSSQNNLDIFGQNNSAGFIVEVTGTVKNCSTTAGFSSERTVDGAKITANGSNAGFTVTVAQGAEITSCTANTALRDESSKAFAVTNKGYVKSCYAWYAGGSADDVLQFSEKADENISDHYYACYFAELNQKNAKSDKAITLCKGSAVSKVSYDELAAITPKELCPDGTNAWSSAGKYSAYPFSNDKSLGQYAYPMVHQHYGDWVSPTMYAYGVIYYEKMKDNTVKLSLHDLSNPEINEWKGSLSMNTLAGKDTGTITETGYIVFYRNASQIIPSGDYDSIEDISTKLSDSELSAIKSAFDGNLKFKSGAIDDDKLNDIKENYTFRLLNDTKNFDNYDEEDGKATIELYNICGVDAGVHSYVPSFADAVYRNTKVSTAEYKIRTEQQFNNISAEFAENAANLIATTINDEGKEIVISDINAGMTVTWKEKHTFIQTHSFTLSSVPRELDGCFVQYETYNGNGCTIDAGDLVFENRSLFGNVGEKATITKCTLVSPKEIIISDAWDSCGILVDTNAGKVTECTVKAADKKAVSIDASGLTVGESSVMNVGGIVGCNTESGTVKKCTVSADISFTPPTVDNDTDTDTELNQTVRLGGIIGYNDRGSFEGKKVSDTEKYYSTCKGDIVYNSQELPNESVKLSSEIYLGGAVGESVGANDNQLEVYGYGDVLYKEPYVKNHADTACDNVTENVYVGGIIGSLNVDSRARASFTDILRLISDDESQDESRHESTIGIQYEKGSAAIKGTHYVGGLVGNVDAKAKASDENSTAVWTAALRCNAKENGEIYKVVCVPASEGTYVGGAVGKASCENNSTYVVSGEVHADITVDAGTTKNAYVGGVVGYNTAGTVSCTAKGSITMSNTANACVGGAVGYADGGTYKDSTADVDINGDFTRLTTGLAVNPSGYANVGKFVGRVHNGTFENCNGNGKGSAGTNPAEYQFLGTIVSDGFNFDTSKRYYYATVAAKDGWSDREMENLYYTGSDNDNTGTVYNPAEDSLAYYHFSGSITLTDCYYLNNSGVKYQQTLSKEFYYTASDDITLTKYIRGVTAVTSFVNDGMYVITNSYGSYALSTNGSSVTSTKFYPSETEAPFYTVWVYNNGYMRQDGKCIYYNTVSNGLSASAGGPGSNEEMLRTELQHNYVQTCVKYKWLGLWYYTSLTFDNSGNVSADWKIGSDYPNSSDTKLIVYKVDAHTYYNAQMNYINDYGQSCRSTYIG